MGENKASEGEAHMTFPPMPDWFPDFGRELFALSQAELRELYAMLAEDEERAETAKCAHAHDSEKQERQRKARLGPPDGLRTMAEAAGKLGCSIKTLNGHVAAGALGYVAIGHGTKRPRKMFTDSDLNAFIAAQTRKDFPCPSTAPAKRLIGISTSNTEVIGFTARRNARLGVKPKK